jgi:hypothetical protein
MRGMALLTRRRFRTITSPAGISPDVAALQ